MQKTKPVSRIAFLREQIGLTQLELAQLLDVTENTVANWEKGRGSLEWIDRVIKLCKIFRCTPDILVEYVPDNEPVETQPKTKKSHLEELRRLINTHEPSPSSHNCLLDTEPAETQPKTGFLEDLRKLANTQEPTSASNSSQSSKSQNLGV
ncbi:helix-turn-helix transcriptional regulator [Nostoc sp. UHCC 0870]|uniref:helix-turn-helix transcriptional regulator n=1 Tax=Nostoc sp. UHCC 0870 TaxID=2914041 RepID=UPI001EDCC994|nr:helix-turn-helix transcriptional regulator [Nostoc sp. UHCC 0870]UKP01379.1 helix-turn-helix domain-containing protein [Nostoc sp. UHCC 0870]